MTVLRNLSLFSFWSMVTAKWLSAILSSGAIACYLQLVSLKTEHFGNTWCNVKCSICTSHAAAQFDLCGLWTNNSHILSAFSSGTAGCPASGLLSTHCSESSLDLRIQLWLDKPLQALSILVQVHSHRTNESHNARELKSTITYCIVHLPPTRNLVKNSSHYWNHRCWYAAVYIDGAWMSLGHCTYYKCCPRWM